MFLGIEVAMETLRQGKMLILVDDEGRENEGDLLVAAEFATADVINFMATHARGLVCMPIEAQRAEELQLEKMCAENTSLHGTCFTVSVDARCGIDSGISTYDRARTIAVILDESTKPDELVRPGHVFPLVARDGGVLRRAGHTEAAVDLARLAGLRPAGVLCEVLAADGAVARLPQLQVFGEEHGIGILKIADLISYRERTASVERQEELSGKLSPV
jgi:3,4-dihydroxy 2-butanone 4-phosphate synthase/GTP cyclohydrolase II